MAATLPAALKTADVQRFATRAAQLEKYKPIASYWLEYYVLQQILSRSLHNESGEVAAYAAQLMDKLEGTKLQFPDEPAILDDVAAQAYMEQFAGETLTRAEKAQFDNTVTRQTADTLQAAATFYDSTAIWGELSAETKAKIKFAKFHALRIAKALKAGEDPNETNPKPQPVEPAVSTDDAEIQDELRRLEHDSRQPTVEEAWVEMGNATGQPLVPTFSPVSPVNNQETSTVEYFPPTAETAPDPVSPDLDSLLRQQQAAEEERKAEKKAARERLATPFLTSAKPAVVAAPPPAPVSLNGLKTDDDAVMAAQKHAKWAISALNFEDVPTAVRELKLALESLGGL